VTAYRGFYGYDRLEVSAVAFAGKEVFLATNHGLFGLRPELGEAYRLAVGGALLDVPVTSVFCTGGSTLHVQALDRTSGADVKHT